MSISRRSPLKAFSRVQTTAPYRSGKSSRVLETVGTFPRRKKIRENRVEATSRAFARGTFPRWPFSHRAQSKMSAAAFSLSARAAVATRVTAPVQQRRGACLPSRLPPRALPDPHAWKNPGDRLGRVSGLGFVLPAPERVPGTPREPRTTPNAFASSGTRRGRTAGGPFGPGRRACRRRRRDAASPSESDRFAPQWITCYVFSPSRLEIAFLSHSSRSSRDGTRRASLTTRAHTRSRVSSR